MQVTGAYLGVFLNTQKSKCQEKKTPSQCFVCKVMSMHTPSCEAVGVCIDITCVTYDSHKMLYAKWLYPYFATTKL